MQRNQIFSSNFLNLDFKDISNEIKKNGFFCFEKALSDEFVDKIYSDVKSSGLSLNTNNIAGVYFTHGNQFFLTHMLGISEKFFDYCTSDKVLDVCTDFLGDEYRLKALRYYENFGGQNMQWHTDNKYYDQNKKGSTITKTPGLIFITYISDVNDGEFQYVKGSHLWSSESKHHDYSQKEIESKFSKDIVGFKKPKGSLLIYNTFGIHRAKPTKNKNFVRKSLFFQVDREINHSEPILIKTEFVKKLDDRIKMYLGFGKRSGQRVYPETSLETMPFNKETSYKIFGWMIGRFANKLPGFLRKRVRRVLKKDRSTA